MKIRDVMTTGVLVAKRHESVRSVVMRMLSRHCGSVPVVGEEQELLGIVTVCDILLEAASYVGLRSFRGVPVAEDEKLGAW